MPFPNALTSPPTWRVVTERGRGGKYVRRRPRNRGTLAMPMRDGFLLDPQVDTPEPRQLRRLSRSGVRGVPGDPARARGGADGLLHAEGRALVLGQTSSGPGGSPRRARRSPRSSARGPSDLVFVPNATSGLNAAIRSLRLEPGDEILTTAHEYGAIVRTWESIGATFVVREPGEIAASIGAPHARGRASRTSRRRRRWFSRWRRSAQRPAGQACSRSSTALTLRGTFQSTSRRSAQTSMRATATSGSALRRAPGSCGLAPSIRAGSSRSS